MRAATRHRAAATCAAADEVGNNGRLAHLARRARQPLTPSRCAGVGRRHVPAAWERERPAPPAQVVDAHSLYFETRAELGWIGLVLLAIALAGPARGGGRAAPRPGRHAYAAFLAAGIALLVHAGIDWDWEMPALFVWFFGAAGVVLAAPAERAAAAPAAAADAPARRPRLPAPGADAGDWWCSRRLRLNRSAAAFERGDCASAIDAALDSLDALPVQPGAVRAAGLVRRARRPAQAGAGRDARGAPRATPATGSTPTGSRSPRRSRARTRRRAPRLARVSTRSSRWPQPRARLRSDEPARGGARVAREGRDPARVTWLTRKRRAGARLSRIDFLSVRAQRCVAGAAPEHEARAEQRDAAEQHRDRGEAGERQLAPVSAPASTWRAGWTSPPPPLARRRWSPPARRRARVLVAEDVAAAARASSGPYCATLASSARRPETARPAPVVLSSMPSTSMVRMTSRDFIVVLSLLSASVRAVTLAHGPAA